ncbi:DUF1905 domain-containing protein [Nocardioides sp.]|uniref:DUF1905 domain-containing protein n=1 Tax=Nocardioides sp. TaxID=35761 RepID=UPI003514042D
MESAAAGGEPDGVGTWEFEAEPWPYETGSWVFVTLPEDVDEEVRLRSGPRRGFGSVRVEVSCGSSTWSTSVFPSADGFVLPLKAAVRRAELLEVGSPARFTLRLL